MLVDRWVDQERDQGRREKQANTVAFGKRSRVSLEKKRWKIVRCEGESAREADLWLEQIRLEVRRYLDKD